jgi:hypothetical protein
VVGPLAALRKRADCGDAPADDSQIERRVGLEKAARSNSIDAVAAHSSLSANRSPRTGSRVTDRQRFEPLADGDSTAL